MILELLSLVKSKDLTANALYRGEGFTHEVDLNVNLTPGMGWGFVCDRYNSGWANVINVGGSLTGNLLSGESQITAGGFGSIDGITVSGPFYPDILNDYYVAFGISKGGSSTTLQDWGYSSIADPSFVPGSTQTITHNLGVVPEAMWIWSYAGSGTPKRWHHRWHSGTGYVYLDGYDYQTGNYSPPPGTSQPFNLTSTTFDISGELTQVGGGGGYSEYNAILYGNGQYVYCGSFSGAGSVSVGWQPHTVIFYPATAGANVMWNYIKSRDDLGNNTGDYSTTWTPDAASSPDLKRTDDKIIPSSTGFTVSGLTGNHNYIAIR